MRRTVARPVDNKTQKSDEKLGMWLYEGSLKRYEE